MNGKFQTIDIGCLFGSGTRTALPIWDKYMLKVYQHPETGYTKGTFKRPYDMRDLNFDCSRYEADIDSTIQIVQ